MVLYPPLTQDQQNQLQRAQWLSHQQAQDPHSVYLQEALQSLGQLHSQGDAMGLGSNLLADALDQYALNRRRQQLTAQYGSQQAAKSQAAAQQSAGATPTDPPF